MKRLMLSLMLTCAAAAQVHALGSVADVRVISRDTGAVLQPYYYRGEYWVAGEPGERYAIEIRNQLATRVLAVTSVDGINVVSGETAAWGQTGYVFSPGDQYQITGWRKSDAEVAAFSFTVMQNSYAQRTGRPQNVGVIGVALFRERAPEPAPPMIQEPERLSSMEPRYRAQEKSSSDSTASNGVAAPAPSPTPSLGALSTPAPIAALGPSLGTAHGAREVSYVGRTEFQRSQTAPNEVIHIRYDSRANLLAMGVIPPQRQPRLNPNPFPETQPYRYVPDPPG